MNNTLHLNTSFDNEPAVCKIYTREFMAATASRE